MNQPDRAAIQSRIDGKTRPPGTLGRLEELALQLASITGSLEHIVLSPELLLFAADHGVARHPISIAPRSVTQQMVGNFLAGGAAVNVFARRHGIPVSVIDCGMLVPSESSEVVDSRLGSRTTTRRRRPGSASASRSS